MTDVIRLNIGGVYFETTKDTLRTCDYFRLIFENSKPSNELFIDRSPHIFKHILSLLRDPLYQFPDKYLSELDFYLVDRKQHKTDNKLDAQQLSLNRIYYELH